MNDYGQETQLQVTPNSILQCESSFMKFLQFYRTKKVINQGKFKIHWWVHREAGKIRWEGLCYKSKMRSDDILSSWNGRNQCSAKLTASKKFLYYHMVLVQIQFVYKIPSSVPVSVDQETPSKTFFFIPRNNFFSLFSFTILTPLSS